MSTETDAPTESPSAQSYVHECGDGAYISMTLSDGPPGHIYPAALTLDGACLLCDAEPILLRATAPEYLAELDAEDDEEGDFELMVACPGGRASLANPSSPDTSQPYFLDLIERIDDATAQRPG